MANPKRDHWTALKRVLRYLQGTIDTGLSYGPDQSQKDILTGFADANFATDIDSRKSVSGYLFTYYGGAVIGTRKLKQVSNKKKQDKDFT